MTINGHRCYHKDPGKQEHRRHRVHIKRGERIDIAAEAVPADAVDDRNHNRENALVIWGNLHDAKVGTFHKMMFNAGTKGVIFKHVLDSEVLA